MLTALLFAGCFATLAGIALWRHPIYGLHLYLIVFYVHPPSRWWGAQLPDLRWSMLAAAVMAIALMIHIRREPERRPWATTVPALVAILFVAWMWVQNAWALDAVAHGDASVQFMKYIVVFYFIYRLANTPDKIRDVLLVHVAGCVYLGWLCFEAGRSDGARLDGVGGPGIDNANTLAMVLATGFIVAAALLLTQTGWRRVACMLSIPLILNGVVLAGSRGAFLGLLVGGLVLYALRPPQRRWMFWVFAALGLALTARLADTTFIERMFTIEEAVKDDGEIDSSAESRIVLAEAQLRMFGAYPFGSGHKGTAALSPQYLDQRWLTQDASGESARSSHNTFMTVLTEQGIPGAMLFVWLTLWGLASVFQLRLLQRHKATPPSIAYATACCAGMAVIWVSGQFTDYLMAEVQIWLLALLAASFDRLRSVTRAEVPAPTGSPLSSSAMHTP